MVMLLLPQAASCKDVKWIDKTEVLLYSAGRLKVEVNLQRDPHKYDR